MSSATVQLNLTYLKSIPGLIKVGEIVLQVILIICLGCATSIPYLGILHPTGVIGFAWFTTVASLIWAVINLTLYLIGYYEQNSAINLNLIKLSVTGFWSLCHFINLVVCAYYADYYSKRYSVLKGFCNGCNLVVGGLGAASFFHLASMLVFGADAFLYFLKIRQGTSSTNT